jgi:hypothetical protein
MGVNLGLLTNRENKVEGAREQGNKKNCLI